MAAETPIYGRFGYGMASTQLSLTIPRCRRCRRCPVRPGSTSPWRSGMPRPTATSSPRSIATTRGCPEVWGGRAGRRARRRSSARRAKPTPLRSAAARKRCGCCSCATGPTPCSPTRPSAAPRRGARRCGGHGAHVREAVALAAAAAHRMWSVLLDLDLTSRVQISNLPVDDPIVSLLVDLRPRRPDYQDNSWLRIVDLPAALAQRRYAGDVDVVLRGDRTRCCPPTPAAGACARAGVGARGGVTPTVDDRRPRARHPRARRGASRRGLADRRSRRPDSSRCARPPHLRAASAAWSWPVAAGANWVF